MVSTQIITPAVWTETARNVVATPSFELATVPVEVRRNRFNPGALVGLGLASAGTVLSGAYTGFYMTVTPGEVYSFRRMLPLSDRFRVGFTTVVPAAGVAFFGGWGTVSTYDATEVYDGLTVPATAAYMIIYFSSTGAGSGEVLIERAATAGAYFKPGQPSPDIDLTPAWVGAVDASESILTGMTVAGVSAVGCFAIRSSQWAKEGAYSLRLIPNSPTNNVSYAAIAFAGGNPDTRGTAIVTRRQVAPITGSVWASGIGRVYWNPVPQIFSNAAPNAAGETELRVYAAPSPGTPSTVILSHGGVAGTADVWYDLATIVPGVDYTGPAFSGDSYSTSRKRYRWLDLPGNSTSVEEVMTAAEVTAPVYEEVTLTSPDDSITFRALPDNGGFVYDNETLQRWYEPAEADPDVDGRPNANGSYGLGQVFTAEHRPIIVGQYYGTSSIDAKAQRQRLIAMRNEGNPILMTVKDESGVSTRREVWLVDYAAPFAADFSHFTFDLDMIAPDALRYGTESSDSDGMPTQGSGLVWNLGTAPSGLYFDWGTPGNPGQISLTNEGGAASPPRIEVGGPGAINGGFRITEIETGRELTFSRTLGLADTVVFDSRTQRATLNGGDVTGLMTARQWYSIPKGATRRYQITPLGAVSGAPTITGYVGAAWL